MPCAEVDNAIGSTHCSRPLGHMGSPWSKVDAEKGLK